MSFFPAVIRYDNGKICLVKTARDIRYGARFTVLSVNVK